MPVSQDSNPTKKKQFFKLNLKHFRDTIKQIVHEVWKNSTI